MKRSVPRFALPVIQELINFFGQAFIDELNSGSYVVSQPERGAWWISRVTGHYGFWNGEVVSAYYHPTREHTATTVGKLGTKRSYASAGHWAISVQTKAGWGNKTYYNTL